jgi:hypothetical protein
VLLAVVGGWVASVFTAFNTWVCLVRKKWSKFFSFRILEVRGADTKLHAMAKQPPSQRRLKFLQRWSARPATTWWCLAYAETCSVITSGFNHPCALKQA